MAHRYLIALLLLVALSHDQARGYPFSSGPPSVGPFSFVSAANLGNNGNGTLNYSAAFTVSSGANRCLVVVLNSSDAASDYTPASGGYLTYNAIQLSGPYTYVGNWGNSLWFLTAPPSGANTLAALTTVGTSQYIQFTAGEYDGCAQSGQPDNSAGSSDTVAEAPYSTNFTPASNGSLVIGIAQNDGPGGTVSPPFSVRGSVSTTSFFWSDTIAFNAVAFSTNIPSSGDGTDHNVLSLYPASGVTPP